MNNFDEWFQARHGKSHVMTQPQYKKPIKEAYEIGALSEKKKKIKEIFVDVTILTIFIILLLLNRTT